MCRLYLVFKSTCRRIVVVFSLSFVLEYNFLTSSLNIFILKHINLTLDIMVNHGNIDLENSNFKSEINKAHLHRLIVVTLFYLSIVIYIQLMLQNVFIY